MKKGTIQNIIIEINNTIFEACYLTNEIEVEK